MAASRAGHLYAAARSNFVRNGSMPCVAGTVDGHQPFYVGFTLSFNWKTFLDEQLAAGAITQAEHDQWITYTHWAGGPPGYNQAQGATGAGLSRHAAGVCRR